MKYIKRILTFYLLFNQGDLNFFPKFNVFFLVVSFIDYIPDLLPILFFLYLNCLKMYHYLEINHYILRNEKHLSYKGRSLILLSQHGPTFIATEEQVTGKKKTHKGYTGARRYLCLPKQF